MALAAQALEAKKARKPLEQGRALEQVGARMKRVMGLTSAFSRGSDGAKRRQGRRLEGMVGSHRSDVSSGRNGASTDICVAAASINFL